MPPQNNKSAVVNAKPKQSDPEPAPPKKPVNAFFKWRSANFESIKQKNPDIIGKDINALIKEEWAKFDPIKKKKMEDEYKSEMENWKVANKQFQEAHPESSKKSKQKKDAASDEDTKGKKKMKIELDKVKKSKKAK